MTDAIVSHWPSEKMNRQLLKCGRNSERKPNAVLLSTGAYNPVHNGHINVFEEAREAVERKGYTVIAGFLSPSHDQYVRNKMKSFYKDIPLGCVYASSNFRIQLVKDACSHSDWLDCASWEASQDSFRDFDEVQYALYDYLLREGIFTDSHDTVFYVCDLDHYTKCSLYQGIPQPRLQSALPVVVVLPQKHTLSPPTTSPNVVVVQERDPGAQAVSSSQVREALVQDISIQEMIPAAVYATLQSDQYRGGLYTPQHIFISFSGLCRQLDPSIYPPLHPERRADYLPIIPEAILETALFFFGSKRLWFFPETVEETQESLANNPDYIHFMKNTPFGDLLQRKEKRGEVCFLKPDILGPVDVEGGIVGDYSLASTWMQSLGYPPLLLDEGYWSSTNCPSLSARECSRVVENFQTGLHDYNGVLTLLQYSVGTQLIPVLTYSPEQSARSIAALLGKPF